MFKWDFAISYAGEESGLASDLRRLLLEKGANVFFATSEKVYLWGKKQEDEFKNIFGTDTKFAVILLSKHYVKKFWPVYEFKVAKIEQQNRDYEYILPIRVDDINMEGFDEDVGYIDLRKEGLFSTAEMMIKKLTDIYPAEKASMPRKWVAAFGLAIEDLMENYELPAFVSRFYPHLCDWLEEDLMKRLSKSPLAGFRFLEDSRDGETLSVRVSFEWDPLKVPIDFGDIGWWEVLEISEFFTEESKV